MFSSLHERITSPWASARRVRPTWFRDYLAVPDDEKSGLSASSSSTASDDPEFALSGRRLRNDRNARRYIPSFHQLVTFTLIAALAIIGTLHMRLRASIAPPPRLDCGLSLEEAHAKGCTFDPLSKSWLPAECPRYGMEEYLAAGYGEIEASPSGFLSPHEHRALPRSIEPDLDPSSSSSSKTPSTANNNPTGSSQQQQRLSAPPWPFYHDRAATQPLNLPSELGDMAYPIEQRGEWWTTGAEHVTHCAWILIRTARVHAEGGRKDGLVSDPMHTRHCALWLRDMALKNPEVWEIRTRGNSAFGHC